MKMKLTSLVLVILSWALAARAQGNVSCPNCQMTISPPLLSPLSANTLSDFEAALAKIGLNEKNNVARMFQPQLRMIYPNQAPLIGPVWDGQGELPNAFHRPWELMGSTNFDPSFQTPYWNEVTGFNSAQWQSMLSVASMNESFRSN